MKPDICNTSPNTLRILSELSLYVQSVFVFFAKFFNTRGESYWYGEPDPDHKLAIAYFISLDALRVARREKFKDELFKQRHFQDLTEILQKIMP